MVSATVVENVSIDPFGKLVRLDNTTLKYGSEKQIELVDLEYLQQYLDVRLPPKLATCKHNKKKLYISNIPPSLIKKHISCVNPELIIQSKEKLLVTQLTSLLVNCFEPNDAVMHVLNARNFSIFTIGYLDKQTDLFQPIGCAHYHFNPLVGVFVSFLIVAEKLRKVGYGSCLLLLLQTLFNKNMGTSRMLVWVDCSESTKLISFYRKLGFFPTIPSNYPLNFLLQTATISDIRSVDKEKNRDKIFLLEVRKLIWEMFDKNKMLSIPPMKNRDLLPHRIKPSWFTNTPQYKCN